MEKLITGVLFVICVFQYFYHIHRSKQKQLQLEQEKKAIREDAIKSSKSVLTGKIAEEMIPLFKDFPYDINDCKFSGMPLDYIVFSGMSELRNKNNGEIELVFADVKTGNAKLSKIQKAIRDAVKNNRIRFEEWIIHNDKIIIKQ